MVKKSTNPYLTFGGELYDLREGLGLAWHGDFRKNKILGDKGRFEDKVALRRPIYTSQVIGFISLSNNEKRPK